MPTEDMASLRKAAIQSHFEELRWNKGGNFEGPTKLTASAGGNYLYVG